VVESIGHADDVDDADGIDILDFWQAQDRARALLKQRATGCTPRGVYTVQQTVDDYLDHIQGKPSYYEVQKRLSAYVPPELAKKDVAKLTRQDLVKWHRDLAKAPPRTRTKKGQDQRHRRVDMRDPEIVRARQNSANRILGMLKAALNFAVADEKVSEGPWRRVKPFKGVDVARTRYLSIAECQRLLNACDPEFRKLVHALLLTGCRYQEIARLTVADVDIGTLYIQTSKAGKPRHVWLTDEGRLFFEQLAAGRLRQRVDVGPSVGEVRTGEADAGGVSACQHRSADLAAWVTPHICLARGYERRPVACCCS
jgi:integrase